VRSVRILALVSVLLASGPGVFAQQTIEYASISGRVTDASGAVVPGATVTVRHTRTNAVATAQTGANGRFRFPYLRIGPYEILVSRPGFAEARREISLGAGAAFELPLTLAVAGVDTSVTVTSEASVLETARSQIAATVSTAEIEPLPMNGRNFLDLALLVPGVAPANIPSTQLFPETSAVPGVSLSVAGQRNLSNNVVVDGLSANDDAAGLSGITYSVDAVEQFQVVTSGAQAELGRALGGYVSVVTRSGTNDVRGTGYLFFRDDALNAANALSGDTLPMRQWQYGASLGGPIVANRTFYFGNVEHRNLDQMGLTTIAPANVAVIQARLAAVGYPGPGASTGLYPNPVDTTNLLAKVDHQVSGRDQLSVRFSLYDAAADNARGAGGLSAPSASSGLDNRDWNLAFSNTATLGSRSVLETRAQVARADLAAPPSDQIGPAVSISGAASFGTLSNSPTGRDGRLYEVVNSLSHQAGSHAIRAGVDFLYNDVRITFPRAVRGSYSFSSMANFLAGAYNNAGFTQTFGVVDIAQTNPNLGLYVQDEWKAGDAVTLNLGLRYDLQFLDTIDTDSDNVSPRVGVAWTPFPSRQTVVRASAGLFYDRVPLRALANALLSAGNTADVTALRQTSISLSPAQAGAPAFPDILAAPQPSVTLPSLSTMDRHMQNGRSTQASVEVEHQLRASTTISAGYQYLRGDDLIININQNVPTCAPSGSNNGCRPNPDYANNSQYSSAAESSYHGLLVSILQRPSSWGEWRLSYTLSKTMNDVGEFFFSSPIDPTDLSKDWGRSDNDQRHRLVLSGMLATPTSTPTTVWQTIAHGFQVSGDIRAYSAPPFNITSGVTTIEGTPGRPIVGGEFIPRNAGEGSPYFSLDARISRDFTLGGSVRLTLLAEGFNLTNHVNVLTRNTNFGPGAYPADPLPSFGTITAVADPRSFQFGARVRF
jgi:Carboxypeptidase regulatory-like domain/TonB dependent receptor-like, beta-barrel